jgi:hypothetical protein
MLIALFTICCSSLILNATVVSVDKDVFTPSDDPELVRAKMWGKLLSRGDGRDVLDLQVVLFQSAKVGQRTALAPVKSWLDLQEYEK